MKANALLLPGIKDCLQRQHVILDGNFYYQEQLEDLAIHFPDQTKIFTLGAPLATCIERDANRQHSYGKESVEYLYMMIHRFEAGETINTEVKSEEETIDEIVNRLGL